MVGDFNLLICVSIATVIVMIALIDWAYRFNYLLDRPSKRKRHERAIPLVGGLAMFPFIMTGIYWYWSKIPPVWSLAVGVVILIGVGLIDDLKEITANKRLLFQMGVATTVVTGSNILIPSLGNIGFDLGLGPFIQIFSIITIVFFVNALNMLDGLDGLAGSIALIILVSIAIIAFLSGQRALAMLSIWFGSTLIGFLWFNVRKNEKSSASAFLGDSGSMVLGLLVAWLAIYLNQVETLRGVYPATIALLMVYPAGDALGVFLRRLLKGLNPMHPDRSHLHHLMQRAGLTTTQVYWSLIVCQLIIAASALGLALNEISQKKQFAVVVAVLTTIICCVSYGSLTVRFIKQLKKRCLH